MDAGGAGNAFASKIVRCKNVFRKRSIEPLSPSFERLDPQIRSCRAVRAEQSHAMAPRAVFGLPTTDRTNAV